MAVKVVCDFCDRPLDYEEKDGEKRFVFYQMKELKQLD